METPDSTSNKAAKNISFVAIAGFALAVAMFAFCVFVFIKKECQIANHVADALNAQPPFAEIVSNSLDKNISFDTEHVERFFSTIQQYNTERIEWIRSLQEYYKDSSNFNILSLVYMFIATVLIGASSIFTLQQKEEIKEIGKQIETKEKEIGKISITIRKNKKEMNKISTAIKLNSITQLLTIALLQATAIQIASNISPTNQNAFNTPIVRLREILTDTHKQIEQMQPLLHDAHSKDNIATVEKHMYSVKDALLSTRRICEERKWEDCAYQEEVSEDLLGLCQKCLDLLEP